MKKKLLLFLQRFLENVGGGFGEGVVKLPQVSLKVVRIVLVNTISALGYVS